MLRIALAGIWLLASSLGALAGSTINPNNPAQNSNLTSSVLRSNFAAAYTDINNILGMFQGTAAPGSPSVAQDWLDTTITPAVWKKRYNSGWGTIGTFNLSTGVFIPGSLSTPVAANRVLAGPASGAAAIPTFRALVGADLPLPSAIALGGVFSKAAVASNWLRSLGTDGIFTASQPAFSDLTGSLTCAQHPALTGDVTTSAGSCATTLVTAQPGAHTWALGQTFSSAITYGGVTLSNSVTGTGSMVLATSPSLTTPAIGVATGSSLALSGCTIGTDKLCATGTANISGATTIGGALTYGGVTLTNSVTGTGSMVLSASPTLTGTLNAASGIFTSNSATALAVGRLGSTTPALLVDASTATSITGIRIKSAASGGGVAIAAIGEASNGALTIDAQGSGTITIAGTSTGAITLTRATTLSAALTYGGVTLSNSVVGTGAMVLATSPTLTTPVLGVATATSLNGNTFTTGTYTLTGVAGKTLTFSNSLTLAGTDGTTMTFPSVSATITRTVASGAKALATGAISSAACTAAQTDTATGTLTTDSIDASFNADPTAVTGYVPLTSGMLTIIPYPTADTVNFKVCNNTSSSITPGAVTINWRVLR